MASNLGNLNLNIALAGIDLNPLNMLKNALNQLGDLVSNFTKQVYENTSSFEQLNIQFEVFTGNASKANELLTQMRSFASVTPFNTQQIADASAQLMSYGVAAENVMGLISMLGDVSSGVPEKFQRLSYAMGQISVMGRLQGQELRQLMINN